MIAAMVPRGPGVVASSEHMHQVHRITIGTLLLLPIIAAALLTGFPAHAGTTERVQLADRRLVTEIDKSVRGQCRQHATGSVEHSICLAEGRKEAYRAAAEGRRPVHEAQLSFR